MSEGEETLEEKRKKWVESEVEKFKEKMKNAGVGVNANIEGSEPTKFKIDPDSETMDWVRREKLKEDLLKIKEELEQEKREHEEVSSGVTTLNPNQLGKGSGTEFDSIEAMIDSLTEQEHSQNADEKAYAKKVKDELFRKVGEAIKNKTLTSPIVYKEKKGEKSIVGKYVERQRKRARKEAGYDE